MLLFVLILAVTSFAAVNIADRTGNIRITMPGGKVITLTPNQPLPPIPDGATITILTGAVQISATGKSHATVLVGGNQVILNPGDTIRVTMTTTASGTGDMVVNYETANIVVESGSPTIQLLTGSSATLNNLMAEPFRPRAPGLPTGAVTTEEHTRDISPR